MSKVCVISSQRVLRRSNYRSSQAATICISSRNHSAVDAAEPSDVKAAEHEETAADITPAATSAAASETIETKSQEISQEECTMKRRKSRHKKVKAKRKEKSSKWLSLMPEEIGMVWGRNAALADVLRHFDAADFVEPVQSSPPHHTQSDKFSSFYSSLEYHCEAADRLEWALNRRTSRVCQHLRSKKKWSKQKVRIAIRTYTARDFNAVGGETLFISSRIYSRLRERLAALQEERKKAHLPKATPPVAEPTTNSAPAERKKPFKPAVQRQESASAVLAPHQLVEVNVPSDMDEATANLLISLQHRDITPEDFDLLLQLDEAVAPKTAGEQTVSALRTCPAEGPQVGELCLVCLQEVLAGVTLKFLPCDHAFHEECIDRWLTFSSPNCPLDGLPVDGV